MTTIFIEEKEGIYTYIRLENVTVDLNRQPVRLHAACVLGPVPNPATNDRFNSDLRNIFQTDPAAFHETDAVVLQGGQVCPRRLVERIDPDTDELILDDYRPGDGERLFLVAALRCTESRDVSFRTFQIEGKIWIDGQLVYHRSGPFRCRLAPGVHPLVMELDALPKVRSLRISDTQADLQACPELIGPYLARWTDRHAAVVRPHAGRPDERLHRWQLLPRDWTKLATGAPVAVTVCDERGKPLHRMTSALGATAAVPVGELRVALPGETSFLLRLQLTYADVDGGRQRTDALLLARSPKRWLADAASRLDALAAAGRLDGDDRWQLEQLLAHAGALGADADAGIAAEQLQQLDAVCSALSAGLADAASGIGWQQTLERRGAAELFFRSALDGQTERYSVLLPERYGDEPQRRYPLVVLLPVGRHELDAATLAERFRGQLDEDAIVATVSCRGVTLGSYIGEAAFLEALSQVCTRFRVDESRISLSGYSNGGYAAWAMAQAYPHRFASIAVYGGGAAADKLGNLRHVAVLNVCGARDFLLASAFEAPTAALAGFTYTAMLEPGSGHWDTLYFHHHPSAVNWLLGHRTPQEPAELFYRTDKPHHRHIYWLEMTRFTPGCAFAQAEAAVTGPSQLELVLHNVEEIVLSVPLTLLDSSNGSERFDILVNGQPAGSCAANAQQLVLRQSSNGWGAGECDAPPPVSFSEPLSMGLLQIYTKPVIIVLPSRFRSAEEERQLRRAADQYARPHTASWDPDIYVSYPIVGADELTPEATAGCHVIVFACDPDDHDYLAAISSKLKVQLTVDGCRWDAQSREAPYLVQFIQNNPLHPADKLLIVAASHPDLFVRNVFTRRLVIPSYASGAHGYLNKELLVYDGNLHAYSFAPPPVEVHASSHR
ncbi:hypothetical protein B5M42_001965 [Paenibacillus athensensis]|uniref:Peptidase S9 prolyl oligopeptidase catalytic domain-containing protein n=1 Tax=Paenibacillus athensensis TaxID=1967502 RepID=A0A4Y8QAF9_9BACL|nr:hypothetical protein [Paenibacillus athensensis]MCD1257603.1 hypothetical protein [Paenibacillus athensensis]